MLATIGSQQGYCMDPFNKDLTNKYLSKLLLNQPSLTPQTSAFWLDRNMPYLDGSNQTSNQETNPFYGLPFIPGQAPLIQGSLPEFAVHTNLANDVGYFNYHFYLHQDFGSQLAQVALKGLTSRGNKEAFVISDSTSPLAASLNVGHIFPRQSGSYADLTTSMANLINFGAFGIPNTGANLCGYDPQTADEELCARYFQ